MKNENIIFVAGLFPKEIEEEIVNNTISGLQNAANNLQWAFVKGFEQNNVKKLKVLNSLYIGSFPRRYKEYSIKEVTFVSDKFNNHINTSFINLPVYSLYSKNRSMMKHLEKELLNSKAEETTIVAYAMTSNFINVLKKAKMKNSKIKTCLIVPDLPLFMNLNKSLNFLQKTYIKLNNDFIMSNLKYVDMFVFLTEEMGNYLACKKPYVVVEGISIDNQNIKKKNEFQKDKKQVLYTGTLAEKYGIKKLVDNFVKIKNQQIELIICGEGEMKSYIEEIALHDKRVIFKGLVGIDEVRTLQSKVDLVINPRENNEEYTKYSFPSKNLEYMSSGTPLVAYRLDGVPEEYYPYMYIIDDYPNLTIALEELLKKSSEELISKGEAARNFVQTFKNSQKQVQKVMEMIRNTTV